MPGPETGPGSESEGSSNGQERGLERILKSMPEMFRVKRNDLECIKQCFETYEAREELHRVFRDEQPELYEYLKGTWRDILKISPEEAGTNLWTAVVVYFALKIKMQGETGKTTNK